MGIYAYYPCTWKDEAGGHQFSVILDYITTLFLKQIDNTNPIIKLRHVKM